MLLRLAWLSATSTLLLFSGQVWLPVLRHFLLHLVLGASVSFLSDAARCALFTLFQTCFCLDLMQTNHEPLVHHSTSGSSS